MHFDSRLNEDRPDVIFIHDFAILSASAPLRENFSHSKSLLQF